MSKKRASRYSDDSDWNPEDEDHCPKKRRKITKKSNKKKSVSQNKQSIINKINKLKQDKQTEMTILRCKMNEVEDKYDELILKEQRKLKSASKKGKSKASHCEWCEKATDKSKLIECMACQRNVCKDCTHKCEGPDVTRAIRPFNSIWVADTIIDKGEPCKNKFTICERCCDDEHLKYTECDKSVCSDCLKIHKRKCSRCEWMDYQ